MIPSYEKLITDLMKRTESNLKVIKKSRNQQMVYEVTQLINSLYCLIVVPQECFGKKDEKYWASEKLLKQSPNYDDLASMIRECLHETDEDKNFIRVPNISTFNDYPVTNFMHWMRNAVCHDGLGFLPVKQEEGDKMRASQITHLVFKGEDFHGNTNFVAKFKVEVLETMLIKVVSLYTMAEQFFSNENGWKYAFHFKQIREEVNDCFEKWKNQ